MIGMKGPTTMNATSLYAVCLKSGHCFGRTLSLSTREFLESKLREECPAEASEVLAVDDIVYLPAKRRLVITWADGLTIQVTPTRVHAWHSPEPMSACGVAFDGVRRVNRNATPCRPTNYRLSQAKEWLAAELAR